MDFPLGHLLFLSFAFVLVFVVCVMVKDDWSITALPIGFVVAFWIGVLPPLAAYVALSGWHGRWL
jgi:nucleoside recognition membrane protein YjiH